MPAPRPIRLFSLLLLAACLVSLVVFACGCSNKNSTAPNKQKPVRFGLGSEPETLDPRKMTGSPEGQVAFQIFEGLTTQNEQGQILPAAAEKWEISTDGLSYTFHLRQSAKWSNGEPVTAQDFEYSWKSTLDPAFGSKYAEQLYYLQNGRAYNKGTATAAEVGVKALDDFTLQVTLANPTAYFLSLCSFYTYFPVPRQTVAANANWAADPATLVGNGPFRLTTWVHNSKIEFSRNEHYWDTANVKSSRLEYAISDNDTTRLSLFENNQIEMTEAPPVAEMLRLQKENKIKTFPYLATYYYDFNTTKPPFDNPKIRKALSLAIDRAAIVRLVTKGGQQPALAWVPFGIPDCAPGTDFRQTGGNFITDNDIATAKQLLAEAGFPNGQGLPPITIVFNTSENHKAIAETIQEMWKKNLGIETKLANQEWKVFLNTRRKLDFQIARDGWTGDYADPMTFLALFTAGNGNNNSGWKNAEYDKLVQNAQLTLDPALRFQLLHDAEQILMAEMPVLPIYFYTHQLLIKTNLKGVTRNPLGNIYFKTAYIEES